MKKIYKGTIEGNIIRFEGSIGFPVGTHALVTLKPLVKASQEEIQTRQLRILDKGFPLGKKLYVKREDIYVR